MEKGGRNFPSCMSSLVRYHEKRSSPDEAWSILQTLGDDISKIEARNEHIRKEHEQTKQELERTKYELQKIKEEKEQLLLRLSEQMGQKLFDGNPEISDLSDPNRALKIGERFAEIYDNEWTNAFEKLDEKDDITKVQELLNTAQLCYETCKDYEIKQWNRFVKALSLRPVSIHVHNVEEEKKRLSLSSDLKKMFETLRKTKLQETNQSLIQEYHDVAGSVSTKKPEFLSFIKACLESFWVAVIHDPPLYFDFESKPRSKFDASENRVFTKSGEYIWYVVWPSIRLSENGPLLAKGVVQCTSDEKKLKFVKDENVQRHH